MDTIRNYLEAMFAKMPNTEAVWKAKNELLQMMEDKYNELISEGMTENAAVGTVISEFGNLDELAEELGLEEEVHQSRTYAQNVQRKNLSLDDAKSYISRKNRSGIFVGTGVLLCILSIAMPILADGKMHEIELGVGGMFALIAVAIFLFIFNGVTLKNEWGFISKTPCQIDMNTAAYVENERRHYQTSFALRLTIGIVLCAMCWLPAVFLSGFFFSDIASGVALFVMIAVGVFLIITAAVPRSAYDTLLRLNDADTVSGSYGSESIDRYSNPVADAVMSVFWPTTTAFYLIWSFLTFSWHITWIIWPIAAIIHKILKVNFKEVR